jgi:hypothetical protein
MDSKGARALARAITRHRPPDPAAELAARAEHLAAPIPEHEPDDTHGWAVRVTTPSGRSFLVVDAGHLIRDLDRADQAWRSVTEFVAAAVAQTEAGRARC